MKDEDVNWREYDSDFGFDDVSPWRPLDDYPQEDHVFLDDPEDFSQDFF